MCTIIIPYTMYLILGNQSVPTATLLEITTRMAVMNLAIFCDRLSAMGPTYRFHLENYRA